jgi:hypothetical protein
MPKLKKSKLYLPGEAEKQNKLHISSDSLYGFSSDERPQYKSADLNNKDDFPIIKVDVGKEREISDKTFYGFLDKPKELFVSSELIELADANKSKKKKTSSRKKGGRKNTYKGRTRRAGRRTAKKCKSWFSF